MGSMFRIRLPPCSCPRSTCLHAGSVVSFTGGVQREQRGNSLTFSSKIYSDLIITAAMTLHTEPLRESERRRAVKCHTPCLQSTPVMWSLFHYTPTKGQTVSRDRTSPWRPEAGRQTDGGLSTMLGQHANNTANTLTFTTHPDLT